MEWLKINEEGEIEFVSQEVKLVPEVQAILALNYNKQKGDNEGKKKYRAKAECKYLFLVYSNKSPYKDYNEQERIAEAKIDCNFGPEWVGSPELKKLVPKFLKGNQPKVAKLLLTVQRFVDRFEAHLDNIDLNERNASGGLVHKPTDIMGTLERLPRLAETLQELENQVKSGVIVKSSVRGDQEEGWLSGKATKSVTKTEEIDDN
jgi:hypothetical protein